MHVAKKSLVLKKNPISIEEISNILKFSITILKIILIISLIVLISLDYLTFIEIFHLKKSTFLEFYFSNTSAYQLYFLLFFILLQIGIVVLFFAVAYLSIYFPWQVNRDINISSYKRLYIFMCSFVLLNSIFIFITNPSLLLLTLPIQWLLWLFIEAIYSSIKEKNNWWTYTLASIIYILCWIIVLVIIYIVYTYINLNIYFLLILTGILPIMVANWITFPFVNTYFIHKKLYSYIVQLAIVLYTLLIFIMLTNFSFLFTSLVLFASFPTLISFMLYSIIFLEYKSVKDKRSIQKLIAIPSFLLIALVILFIVLHNRNTNGWSDPNEKGIFTSNLLLNQYFRSPATKDRAIIIETLKQENNATINTWLIKENKNISFLPLSNENSLYFIDDNNKTVVIAIKKILNREKNINKYYIIDVGNIDMKK